MRKKKSARVGEICKQITGSKKEDIVAKGKLVTEFQKNLKGVGSTPNYSELFHEDDKFGFNLNLKTKPACDFYYDFFPINKTDNRDIKTESEKFLKQLAHPIMLNFMIKFDLSVVEALAYCLFAKSETVLDAWQTHFNQAKAKVEEKPENGKIEELEQPEAAPVAFINTVQDFLETLWQAIDSQANAGEPNALRKLVQFHNNEHDHGFSIEISRLKNEIQMIAKETIAGQLYKNVQDLTPKEIKNFLTGLETLNKNVLRNNVLAETLMAVVSELLLEESEEVMQAPSQTTIGQIFDELSQIVRENSLSGDESFLRYSHYSTVDIEELLTELAV